MSELTGNRDYVTGNYDYVNDVIRDHRQRVARKLDEEVSLRYGEEQEDFLTKLQDKINEQSYRPSGTIPYYYFGPDAKWRAEERRTNTLTGGQKGEKLEAYALIPVEPLAEVARVYGYGQQKYQSRNWERGYEWSLSYSALMRHANAFWNGESIDPDSGRHHLASVVFHALAMMEWEETHPELDDRPKEKE